MRALLSILTLLSCAASIGAEPSRPLSARPATARGNAVVPDRFLRPWDPVTIFFTKDMRANGGGPEDAPERFVKMAPAHPGAWRWIDARTLQFAPADAWPALARRTVTVDGKTTALSTLMEAPISSVPPEGSEGLEPIDAITLTFRTPLDPTALARAVRIELRALPGLSGSDARWITSSDFEVKAVERAAPSDVASYVLVLREPIGLGQRAVLRLALSLDEGSDQSFTRIEWKTAQPFRALSMGCPDERVALSSTGTNLAREQALSCSPWQEPFVVIEFSADPAAADAIAWRNFVRFTPSVANLSWNVLGKQLRVHGDFARDTEYRVALSPANLNDERGRPLDMAGSSEMSLWFPLRAPELRWSEAQGICERYGPRQVPIVASGQERVDLRIYPLDPLDRTFWPFPDSPLVVDESQRPPGPGEEPAPHSGTGPIDRWELQRQLGALGSPPISEILTLPSFKDGAARTIGLDLAPHLMRLSGKDAPGAYLVGVRRLDDPTSRQWMRIQVTDLCLSTIEEERSVRFLVTSLRTGKPVSGASVAVEAAGREGGRQSWITSFAGTTDATGAVTWTPDKPGNARIGRLVVKNSADILTLDPNAAPDGFRNGMWSESGATWLQWTQSELASRVRTPTRLAHLFTERPIYRPAEIVHVQGWLRERIEGRLRVRQGKGTLVVQGPNGLTFRYPILLSASGGFHVPFQEANPPTGEWTSWFEHERGDATQGVTFRIEAYRIPQFEVRLSSPDKVALDGPFEVALSALYYAGGKVSGRPISWRVTQFPYTLQPPKRDGFRWSSDERWSGNARFQSTPRLEKQDVTDDEGSARLILNPAIEPTAQPRSYVVEATVQGPDDQIVTAVQRVVALPSFVLGLKAPRYIERATTISPEVLSLGPDGKPEAGRDLTVRLIQRQWHSHLRAGDFTSGDAKYVTDVVDTQITEKTLKSAVDPVKVDLALPGAGVYLVELESHDALERAQVVRVDLYAGGDEPVAWQKPQGLVFQVVTDKDSYEPGQVAAFTLKSPFQTAEALAIVEGPEGNSYHRLSVTGGAATLSLPVDGRWTPRVPVHFLLQRGRVESVKPQPGGTTDLGKPATMGATAWLSVKPVANTVNVAIDSPAKARPGETIPVTVTLTDEKGKPLAGEVALWLVDAAVLALGKEQRLDPVPDFLSQIDPRLVLRDTRNLAFGWLPASEAVGGDEGATEEGNLLDRATIRKNFEPVPYYEPSLQVDASGKLTVRVALPDNLTVFKIRAKAASGEERFGAGTGQVAVRLPILVEPALPRFVRPGDRFVAAAIGRIVEGGGGAGKVEARIIGALLEGAMSSDFEWDAKVPKRLEFPVRIETPKSGETSGAVSFRIGVSRSSDGAMDAFEVQLPLRDDRKPEIERLIVELTNEEPVAFPAVGEGARPGTISRRSLVSGEPALVRMAAGLQQIAEYPFYCTEQVVSRARALVALRAFRDALHQGEMLGDARITAGLASAQEMIAARRDAQGLVAYWPGSRGYVSTTAWSLELLVEARNTGLPVDAALESKLVATLEKALRSDYSRFIDGEAFAERAWALEALSAAGRAHEADTSELARKAQYLDLESKAHVLLALARAGAASSSSARVLETSLMEGLVFRLHQGREIYGGLQAGFGERNGIILPHETRTVAEVLRSLVVAKAQAPRIPVLVDALVTLGRGSGWGTTNADAAALLALTAVLQPPFTSARSGEVEIVGALGKAELEVGPDAPVATWESVDTGRIQIRRTSGRDPLAARLETRWMPMGDGSTLAQDASGFVVEREVLIVRGEDVPADKLALDKPGLSLALKVGDVVEQHVRIVNPAKRTHVAIVVPRAAGLEPLNPALATAPPEAKPSHVNTKEPSYSALLDDAAQFFFDELPAGTYDFWFRERATVAGRFIQPPATAELMYDEAVRGRGCGAVVEIQR